MKKLVILSAILLAFTGYVFSVSANHSWGGYHWARIANPFTLSVGDNLSSTWDPYLATTISDWSASLILNMTSYQGSANPKTCKPTLGKVEVCNSKYGNNGWLGIAQIWITTGSHITQGAVKLNDTYFTSAKYNNSIWKNFVMCQEIGHTLGLDHQDEDFYNINLGTCMDYTTDPTPNQHPNQHDYDMLESIYAHLDSVTTIISTFSANSKNDTEDLNDAKNWGQLVKSSKDGKSSTYRKDLNNGESIVTHVIWAE